MKKIIIAALLTAILVGCTKAEASKSTYDTNADYLVGSVWQHPVTDGVVKALRFDTENSFTTWYSTEDGTAITTSIGGTYTISGDRLGEIQSFKFSCLPFYLEYLGDDVKSITYVKGFFDSNKNTLSIWANIYDSKGNVTAYDERWTLWKN